jgi:hypothetical protein
MANLKFLVVGTVSNVENQLSGDFLKIYKSLCKLGEIETFLVESDSQDGTKSKLEDFSKQYFGFGFESLGNLKELIPNRIERIRFCRNRYVEYIRTNYDSNQWNFIVVADLDGMNSAISSKKILRAIENSNSWDVCFSNQTFGYYDLYALRAKGWVEKDCFEELSNLKEKFPFSQKYSNSFLGFLIAFKHFDKLRFQAIYSKMHVLNGKPIKVDSAFGGLAIYKPEIFLNFDYSTISNSSFGKCEHLDLHSKCVNSGLRLFVYPRFINNHWNEYNLNKLKVIRFLKEFKKYLLRVE